MQFDEVPSNCETQPEAAVLASRAAIGLAKPVEHVRQELWGNADAAVGYHDLHDR